MLCNDTSSQFSAYEKQALEGPTTCKRNPLSCFLVQLRFLLTFLCNS